MTTGSPGRKLGMHRPKRRNGFTLVEAVATLAITSILLLAVGQALRFALVASGSVPSEGAASAASQALASDVADQIVADLNVALDFTEKAATAVTFTVPDRGTDGQPDKIRYAWSGASGTPTATPPVPPYTLTRSLNDGPWAALASDVRRCNFTLLYRMATVTPTAAETLLLSYGVNGSTSTDYGVSTNNGVAESFAPPVSASVTSWSITRVQLQLKSDANYDGIIKVQVRTADATFRPTATVLDETLVPEAAFADVYQVFDVPFTKLTNLSPTQNLALVVVGSAGAAPLGTVAWTNGSPPVNTYYTTLSAGAWSAPTSASTLRYAIYGRVAP